MADTWRDCLICGSKGTALRLHQRSVLTVVSDSGEQYEFGADTDAPLSLFYFCWPCSQCRPNACGSIYAASYGLTGDAIEAEVTALAAAAWSAE